MRMTLFMLVILLVASNAPARDIYVNNVVGNNSNRGDAPDHSATAAPVRTITRALRLATRFDRVILVNTGVPYYDHISLSLPQHSGVPSHPFTIIGNGAILDGTAAVPTGAWEHVGKDLFRFSPEYLSYHLLYLDGKPATRREVSLTGARAARPELKPLEWASLRGQVYFGVDPGKFPDNYPVRCTTFPTGITLYQVEHVRIENLVVQGFSIDGVSAVDSVRHCTLDTITSRGNGRSGINVGGSSRVRIENCLIGDNGAAQLRIEGFCKADVQETELVDNTAPATDVQGGRLFLDGKLQPVTRGR